MVSLLILWISRSIRDFRPDTGVSLKRIKVSLIAIFLLCASGAGVR